MTLDQPHPSRKDPIEEMIAAYVADYVKKNRAARVVASGLQVLTLDGQKDLGVHVYEWDGKGNGGQQLPDGLYHVQVTAFDSKNNLLDVLHTTFGRVTGAGVVNGQTTLFLNELRVDQKDVLSVQEAEQVVQETP